MEVMKRLKGLDRVVRVPEELGMDVRNIVQKVVTKIISKNMEFRKAKLLSEDALQTAKKRREAKGKGEWERYTRLNAEFQRTERRDKKAFLIEKRKEIE